MRNIIEIINKIFAREIIQIIDFRISVEGAVLVKKKIYIAKILPIHFQSFQMTNLFEVVFFLKNKMADNEKTFSRKRKAESEITGEVEIFLKIFVELAIKEPEDLDKLIEKTNDNIDGPALDAIIFAMSKFRQLLQSDIDSLKLPNALKVSIRLLKTFVEFIHQSKLLKTLKDATSKKHSDKKRKTIESGSANVPSDQ